MKTKLLIIFMVFALLSAGQVPNTTTFTLQNVVDVVNPTTDDLGDSFNDAILGYFNLAYKNPYYADYSNRNNLLMFRDYGIHNCTNTVTLSSVSGTTSLSVSLNVAAYSVVVVQIGLKGNETITPPSGWAAVFNLTGGGATYHAAYRKAYTTATTETVNFTFSGSTNKIGLVYYVQNCTHVTAIGSNIGTSTTYTTGGAITEYECSTYVSSLLLNSSQTPSITNGTNWNTVGSGLLNTWGFGSQKHYHPSLTGSNIPTTSYSFTNATYAHQMFRFYNGSIL